MSANYGKVTQVIGPVIDVSFEGGKENIPPSTRLSRWSARMVRS